MSNLAEKIRKARETQVEVDGHKYTIRRPTDAQRNEWARIKGFSPLEMVRKCVIDWDLLEVDLLAGGSPTPAEFSEDAFAEYVNDKTELWAPLSKAIAEVIEARLKSIEEAKKN
jgi:hypothetical protein